ncbi:UDP-N-acetylmuramoyl-L-alanyl-D-glutamate--2,6-diaminopimelate ligase [Trichonephila clavata]|uniref:UDP-N-acetylmuramoyl-L-alanyl-D-glutamate--2, 6-diaminopimelate ligase n=1 Tax=Trichonephila clavata TaxID=2740835 RepID=A0A8X6JLY6_TRICU|nr:UDP-N-acetylmuramoyl-L-alanyl-D-glutamate--2,6-diaminopimelate ligase [Trichonephila clavata]
MTNTPSFAVLDHPNPQEIYSEIVSRFYQFKQPKYVAAVTGTNGKTSVVEFCRQIWQNAGYNAASIGTLGTCVNNGRKDYHKNLGEYLETKERLFYEVLPEGKTAILNADIDEYYALLKIAEKRSNKVITYGKKGSDITLLKQTPAPNGQHLTIKIGDEIYDMFFPVLGQFQAYNLLCAMGIVTSSGLNYREMCVEKLVSPPGRMEK